MPKFYYEPSLKIVGYPSLLFKTPSTGGKEALVIPGKEMSGGKRHIYFLGGEAGSKYTDVFGYDITLEANKELADPKDVFEKGGFYSKDGAILDGIKIYELGDINLYQDISSSLPNYALVKDLNKFLSVLVPIFRIDPNNQNFDEKTKSALTSAVLADVMRRYDYDVDQNGTVDAKKFYFLKKAYESKQRLDIEDQMSTQDRTESVTGASSSVSSSDSVAPKPSASPASKPVEIIPHARAAGSLTGIPGRTESGTTAPFKLQNTYALKGKQGKFKVLEPDVTLTKKVVKGKNDRFTLRATNDFILIPVRFKSVVNEAKKHWTAIVTATSGGEQPPSGTKLMYVPVKMIEWTYDSDNVRYGDAQPAITLIDYEEYTPLPSDPQDAFMVTAAYANQMGAPGSGGRDAVAQGIYEYLTKSSTDVDPSGVTLYGTSALRSKMNMFHEVIRRAG